MCDNKIDYHAEEKIHSFEYLRFRDVLIRQGEWSEWTDVLILQHLRIIIDLQICVCTQNQSMCKITMSIINRNRDLIAACRHHHHHHHHLRLALFFVAFSLQIFSCFARNKETICNGLHTIQLDNEDGETVDHWHSSNDASTSTRVITLSFKYGRETTSVLAECDREEKHAIAVSLVFSVHFQFWSVILADDLLVYVSRGVHGQHACSDTSIESAVHLQSRWRRSW